MFVAEKAGPGARRDATARCRPRRSTSPTTCTPTAIAACSAWRSTATSPATTTSTCSTSTTRRPRRAASPRTSRLTRVTVNANNTASAETVILGSIGTPPCPAPSNTVDCIPADSDSHSIGTVRSAPDGTLWLGSGDGVRLRSVDPRALRTYDEQSFAGKIIHIDRNGNGAARAPVLPDRQRPHPRLHEALCEGLPQPVPLHAAPGRRARDRRRRLGGRGRRSTCAAPGATTAGPATRGRSTRPATGTCRLRGRVRERGHRRRRVTLPDYDYVHSTSNDTRPRSSAARSIRAGPIRRLQRRHLLRRLRAGFIKRARAGRARAR